jgi:hypothetical protein
MENVSAYQLLSATKLLPSAHSCLQVHVDTLLQAVLAGTVMPM